MHICVLHICIYVCCTSAYMCVVHMHTCVLHICIYVCCTYAYMCVAHMHICVLHICIYVCCTYAYMCVAHLHRWVGTAATVAEAYGSAPAQYAITAESPLATETEFISMPKGQRRHCGHYWAPPDKKSLAVGPCPCRTPRPWSTTRQQVPRAQHCPTAEVLSFSSFEL